MFQSKKMKEIVSYNKVESVHFGVGRDTVVDGGKVDNT